MRSTSETRKLSLVLEKLKSDLLHQLRRRRLSRSLLTLFSCLRQTTPTDPKIIHSVFQCQSGGIKTNNVDPQRMISSISYGSSCGPIQLTRSFFTTSVRHPNTTRSLKNCLLGLIPPCFIPPISQTRGTGSLPLLARCGDPHWPWIRTTDLLRPYFWRTPKRKFDFRDGPLAVSLRNQPEKRVATRFSGRSL